MESLRKTLLLVTVFATAVAASTPHHYNITEWNVESPQDTSCDTNLRGFFGRSAKYSVNYRYVYEVELFEGDYLDSDEVMGGQGRNANSLPALDDQIPVGLRGVFETIETRVAEALLESSLFRSVCTRGVALGPFRGDHGGFRRQLQQDSRDLRAVGISSAPDDLILEGVTCERDFLNETESGPCMVVGGEFVVYLDIYEELDDALEALLRNMMNERHVLDEAHPYIQTVRYVSISTDGVVGNIEKIDEEDVVSRPNDTLSLGFYALIAAGSIIIVGTAIFYRRRRNAGSSDGETTTLDPNTAQ